MPVGYLPTTSRPVATAPMPTSPVASGIAPTQMQPNQLAASANRTPITAPTPAPQPGTVARPTSQPSVSVPIPIGANNGAQVTVNGQAPAPMPAPPVAGPLQQPGNNMTNPGYSEQALLNTQNRLLEDPFGSQMQQYSQQAGTPTQGENFLNQNLGTLNGPGQGEQYWNQQQGQFMNPFAGEQFARQATQNMSPSGPAGSFFNQAMGQYGDFTGYQGPQASAGQYQQNAASGPLQGSQFYNQVQGEYGTTGRYTDPNLAAGQYSATQQSFGALPTPDSADPFYDRAIQLGTQAYNKDAAGRGVYGSSEALSGVGNVITDLNARRAQTAFGNSMAIAQENRARQALLGEQARMGDLSSLAGFGANLSGLETFGNLALGAGNQELGRQTMLGNQAANVDAAAQAAQNSNIAGLNSFGNLAGQADQSEVSRFNSTTNAMNQADRTALERLGLGADVAFRADDSNRADYIAQNSAATDAARIGLDRNQTAANIASQGSINDLNRLNSFNNAAQGAEGQRQNRNQSYINAASDYSGDVASLVSNTMGQISAMDAASFNDWAKTDMSSFMQAAGFSQSEQAELQQAAGNGVQAFMDVFFRLRPNG